jgi:hypothetical protein
MYVCMYVCSMLVGCVCDLQWIDKTRVFVCMYVCMYVCAYAYIYIYIYIHTHLLQILEAHKA